MLIFLSPVHVEHRGELKLVVDLFRSSQCLVKLKSWEFKGQHRREFCEPVLKGKWMWVLRWILLSCQNIEFSKDIFRLEWSFFNKHSPATDPHTKIKFTISTSEKICFGCWFRTDENHHWQMTSIYLNIWEQSHSFSPHHSCTAFALHCLEKTLGTSSVLAIQS